MIPIKQKTLPDDNSLSLPPKGGGSDDDDRKTLIQICCVLGMMISLIILFAFLTGTVILWMIDMMVVTNWESYVVSYWPSSTAFIIPPVLFCASLLVYFIIDRRSAMECLKFVFWG